MSQTQVEKVSPASSEVPANPIPNYYKWYMLIFLWGAFFLNQGDRQLFNNVLGLIEKDLGYTPKELGLVVSIFTICYGIFVPIAGYVGDVIQKRLLVFLSLTVFSVGTLLTGLVPHSQTLLAWLPGGGILWMSVGTVGLVLLIIVRSVATGIGEAFYYPGANSLIGMYHSQTRATAMAIHQTANYTGVVFGGTIAAWIATQYGWRNAFWCFGVIGIVWAIVLYCSFRNDHRDFALLFADHNKANKPAATKVPLSKALGAILSRPTFYLLSLAFGGMCFVNVGFLTWMPKYLTSQFGVSTTWAAFNATFYHHLLAYVSVFVAAGISDWLSTKVKSIRMQMEFIGLFFGTPFIYYMGASDNLLYVYVSLALFGLFRGVYDSNLFAAMFDVIEPQYRATASGIMLSVAFIIGSASPYALAILAERVNNNFGPGLSWLAVAYFVSAILVLIAILLFYRRDRAAAERTNQ